MKSKKLYFTIEKQMYWFRFIWIYDCKWNPNIARLVSNDLRPEIATAVQEEMRQAMLGVNKTLKDQKDHLIN